jgi:phosphoserine phosphatase
VPIESSATLLKNYIGSASCNCYGEEKVRRIRASYNLDEFNHIYAYGDSEGDKAMLDLAHEHDYKHFS